MSGSREDRAYNRIRTAISKGYITKGSKLAELGLARQLNMNRATVRGAIKRLVFEGLAEFSPNKGASVVNPSLEEIQQSFQVRAQLEKMAAIQAVHALTRDDIDRLEGLIRQETEIFRARELDRYYEVNNNIHLAIAEKSGNQVLVHYVRELLQKTTIYLVLFDPFYQHLEGNNTSPLEHRAIVAKLAEKDGPAAGRAMEKHLDSAMKGIDVKRLLPDDYLTI